MENDQRSRRQNWSDIHSQDASWRKQLVGDINDRFVVARYVRLVYDTFGKVEDYSFFEIGSGNGDLCTAILAMNQGQIRRYVTSEYFQDGLDWLRQLGLECVLADAMKLPVGDREYDAVVEFDVMHHIDRPRDMAHEMMRIAKGRCLPVESNGLSLFRRLKEFSFAH